jgi:hypothetical protein
VSYLVMAQAFAPYGDAGPAIASAFPLEKYPPLFPLAIAVSGGAYDWRIAHLLVAVSFGVSAWLLALLVRRTTGSRAIAFAAALAFAAMPGAWLQMKGILSEFPYIALSLAALLAHGGATSSVSRARSLSLGALLAAALLTRTIGIALLAAIAFAELHRWVRTRDTARLRAWWPALALPVAAAALWYVLRPAGGHDEYVTRSAGVARDFADHGFKALAALVSANVSAITDAWFNALLIYWREPWRPTFLVSAAVGLTGLAACGWRAWRGDADGAYCLVFLAILLAWPFPGQMYRLAFPVAPLIVAGAFWALHAALRGESGERTARTATLVTAAATIASMVPALAFIVERHRAEAPEAAAPRKTHISEYYRIPHGPSAERNAAIQLAVLADLERIGTTTPPTARVMWYVPGYVALLSRRHAVGLDIPADANALSDQVRASRPDFIYLSNVHPRDSGQRHGSPLRPLPWALAYCDVVWARRDRQSGEPLAVLLRVDAARLGNAMAAR